MDEAQWAWLWHYRFIHYIDQQDAAYFSRRPDYGKAIGSLLVGIIEQDDRLLVILANARNPLVEE